MLPLIILLSLAAAADPPVLYPEPQSIDLESGAFDLTRAVPVVVADDATREEEQRIENLFAAIGFSLKIAHAAEDRPGRAAIYIGEAERHASFQQRRLRSLAAPMTEARPQSYRLMISKKCIVIVGADAPGVWYGLQTLVKLIRQYGLSLPCVDIRDHPDLHARGVFVEGAIPLERLSELAQTRCNLIVFSSPELYVLEGACAERWRALFDEARRRQIEPIPLIDPLSNAAPLLSVRPDAVEGRTAVDLVTFYGNDWQPLTHPNLIGPDVSPVEVSVSGVTCARGIDYILDGPPLEYPFRSSRPWRIRALPEGAIPSGAVATARYSYAPPGSAACCPHAPETRRALRQVLGRLIDVLEPKMIHIGHGNIERLNQDIRCRERHDTNAGCFVGSVALCREIVEDIDPDVRLIMWANAIDPTQDARRYELVGAERDLPDDILLCLRPSTMPGGRPYRPADSIVWAGETGRPFLSMPAAASASVYACAAAMGEAGAAAEGILVPLGDDVRLAMEKAWSKGNPIDAWGEGLNQYFGAALLDLSYDDVLDALVRRMNRAVLDGVSPREKFRAFQDVLDSVRERLPKDNRQADVAENLYRLLSEYLELEAAYAESQDSSVPARLRDVVEGVAEPDPETGPERASRILDAIEATRLFVPSSILFRRYVLPFREIALPPGARAYEILATPRYIDHEHEAEAVFDLLSCPGPLFRIDFETVGAARITVERSADGTRFEAVQEWTSQRRGGVRGPILLDRPPTSRFIRVRAAAPAERAVLREVRLLALKGTAKATWPRVSTAPSVDGLLDEAPWAAAAQLDGFLLADGSAYPEAPTHVELCRGRDALYVGVTAFEPRMGTLVVNATQQDAPLWEEESFEIRIVSSEDEVFRFIVNPLAARYDSRGWDRGWDGRWQAATTIHDDHWSAELAIPCATFDAALESGADWRVNFIRTRRNVRDEESAWAVESDAAVICPSGTVTFTATRPF